MAKHYTADFLRMLSNQVLIDAVIINLLNLEVRNGHKILRFRYPLCHSFYRPANHETNLARCFDCQKNFNPIDLVMTMGKYGFLDAVEMLKDRVNQ